MKLLVIGAGAIGGCIGAQLAAAGHDVTLVDRETAHVAAMQDRGLEICGPVASFRTRVRACLPEQLTGNYPVVLLCVKSQDTVKALKDLSPFVASEGFVVSMQNGLNEVLIAEALGEERAMGAFVNFGADYLEPGVIHYGGRGAVVVGELDGGMSQRVQALRSALLAFEEDARISDNIFGYLWSKEAYGAMLFVTALTNDSIADALANRQHRDIYAAIAREVLAVACAGGIRPEAFNGFDPRAILLGSCEQDAERSLEDMVAFNRRSAKTHSGIWRDLVLRKRPTEVVMYEQVLAAGAARGHAMPLTRRMKAMIHEIESGQRSLARSNVDELAGTLS
ncbi:MAG: 2-dehydropantoate 2-reductase [Anaerolineaceae bacterium]|nr:2-dehydropantoate 2-reductase [Anaerolineaceae bacterium]MDE0329570.1 2-dehydropantoate 2-reductase [Anaerolineaceae bacterium]